MCNLNPVKFNLQIIFSLFGSGSIIVSSTTNNDLELMLFRLKKCHLTVLMEKRIL